MNINELTDTIEAANFDVLLLASEQGYKIEAFNVNGSLSFWGNIKASANNIQHIELVSYYHFKSYEGITQNDITHFMTYNI